MDLRYKNEFIDKISTNDRVSIVEFWSYRCEYCRYIAPLLNELSNNNDIDIYKFEAEKFPYITSHFKVNSLPTVVVCKNGTVVDRLEGFDSADNFIDKIEKLIG